MEFYPMCNYIPYYYAELVSGPDAPKTLCNTNYP
jgi:hypothetical protein